MARSDLVIVREQFIAVAAENLSLREQVSWKDRLSAGRDARNEELEAAMPARERAEHASEIAGRDEAIGRPVRAGMRSRTTRTTRTTRSSPQAAGTTAAPSLPPPPHTAK